MVPDGGRYSIVNDGSVVNLTIQDVTANDAGKWQCNLTVEVNNTRTIGDPVVRSITLFVVGKNCFCSNLLASVFSVFKGIASVCQLHNIPALLVSDFVK